MLVRRSIATFLIGGILILAGISACGHGGRESPSPGSADPFSNVRGEIPFEIVIPKYFPSGVDVPHPQVRGPNEGSGDSVGVSIVYLDRSQRDKMIIIDEENSSRVVVPSGESFAVFESAGLEILEKVHRTEIITALGPSGGETITLFGFLYSWKTDSLSFIVEVYGYSQDESRRVVKSMTE